MTTNEESLKIQDIIDKVNKVWSEGHEENRKKIISYNIFRVPIVTFIGVSIYYFSPLAFFLPPLISSTEKSKDLPLRLVEILFNLPYYIFDIRASIIVSIASILLSLYVSVGKFADDAKGIIGESRRAAYRQFAKGVGYIVSIMFSLNFWHGLLAGYFQGGYSIAYPFKYWIESPAWGRYIVPGDLDLSRYGEMPLWVLLFFAWFTLSSCLMLTYNEKDILLKNIDYLQNIKNISSVPFMSKAYDCATEQVNTNRPIPRLSVKRKKIKSSYQDLFFLNLTGYAGFKFSNEPRLFGFMTWMLFALLYTPIFAGIMNCKFGDDVGVKPWVIAIFASFILFVFEALFKGLSGSSYLYFYIYRMQVKAAHKSWLWACFKIFLSSAGRGLIRILLLLIAFLAWVDPSNRISSLEDMCKIFTSEKSYYYWVFIAIFYFVKYFIIRILIWCKFRCNLKRQTESYLHGISSCSLGGQKKNKHKEYLMIAYMYCTMLKINEYYSRYKDEIGASDSENDDTVEYKSVVKKTPDISEDVVDSSINKTS
jgi:hypothetical protein